MFNFHFNITDYLKEIPSNIFVIGIVFLIVVLIGLLALYIFSSLGIMKAAKKNGIPNAWIAFIPYGRDYIIGKLGFEVYPEESKRIPALTWVLFGLSVAPLILDTKYDGLLIIGITVLNAMAFYNMFKVIVPENSAMFTIFTILVGNLGGVFLYSFKNNLETQKEVKKTESKEIKTKEKENKKRPNFCPNCGNKLTKTIKFCPECGEKIE